MSTSKSYSAYTNASTDAYDDDVITQSQMKEIASHTNLKSLDLSGKRIKPTDFQWLADLRGLQVLNLRGTAINDSCINYLSCLYDLTELDLSGTLLTCESLPTICNLDKMQKLSCSFQFTDSNNVPAFKLLQNLKRLKTLAITIEGNDVDYENLSSLNTIEELSVRYNKISSKAIEYLSSMRNLQKIQLEASNSNVKCPDCPDISVLFPNLETVHLVYMNINDQWLSELSKCNKLKYVLINQTKGRIDKGAITDMGVGRLARLGKLRELHLHSCSQVSDDGVRLLSSVPGLTNLVFSGSSKLSDKSLRALGQARDLRELGVSSSMVTDAGVVHLKNLQSLEVLDLSNTPVTDTCIPYLAKLTTLRKLYLIGTHITSTGEGILSKILPDCEVIMKRGTIGWGHIESEVVVPPKILENTISGKVVDKGEYWIGISHNGDNEVVNAVPRWLGGSPDEGGCWEKATLDAIKSIRIGSRVTIRINYDIRLRIIDIATQKE
ncbi:MAG: hypothetical protein U0796_00375 [Gemmatales bacterium]